MTDDLTSIYLVAHLPGDISHPRCETCIGHDNNLEFLENDLVEFRYPNSSCPFCMSHLRLGKRFPMKVWKPLLDAGGFTLVADSVRDHPERMRVVSTPKRRARR